MAVNRQAAHRGYDIIGDIHGCANTLIRLLEQMGYRKVNGVYQHHRRQASSLAISSTGGREFAKPCIWFATWWNMARPG